MESAARGPASPKEMSTAALAFVGDAVYSLLVREKLCLECRSGADVLHKSAVAQVRCQAQSEAIRRVLPILTEEELAVYNRGRNAHSSHTPKNAAVADYRAATGVEALFGYIYMCKRQERLRELFSLMQADCRQEEPVTGEHPESIMKGRLL